ncbi:hypothetical protein BP00DRAFT_442693 [Aspergillus indologenus CBS 114.80]|uniref:Uncharacterized protein n=1 Tax=Aspergillus indologenus CBS 114.80 TaxID=1450541 RepID=A0A2V5IHA9_9EURO|nr:hypothetical protein BP00DRAFT_442693 [Aspergillus indologenus CBS 114.80]
MSAQSLSCYAHLGRLGAGRALGAWVLAGVPPFAFREGLGWAFVLRGWVGVTPRRFGGGEDLLFGLPHAQARSRWVHALVALMRAVAVGEVNEANRLSPIYRDEAGNYPCRAEPKFELREARLVMLRGDIFSGAEECTNCKAGKGKWKQCVAISKEILEGIRMDGQAACANCIAGWKGYCSFDKKWTAAKEEARRQRKNDRQRRTRERQRDSMEEEEIEEKTREEKTEEKTEEEEEEEEEEDKDLAGPWTQGVRSGTSGSCALLQRPDRYNLEGVWCRAEYWSKTLEEIGCYLAHIGQLDLARELN